MFIAAYASPLIAHEMPTGVGQHIWGMFRALQERGDVSFRLVTPRGAHAEALKFVGAHNASRLLPVPWSDLPLRFSTTVTSLVSLDRWLGDAEWVYVPVEQPVTTSRKLLVTVHDLYQFERDVPGVAGRRAAGIGWRLPMRRILKHASLIATVSEFTRSRLLELFRLDRPERVIVVGNGAEGFSTMESSEESGVLERHGLARHEYVLFPASLTRRKAGDLLLRVARLAHDRRSGLQFVVVGRRHDPDVLAEADNLKKECPGIQLRFLGYVPQPELAVLYRQARAALFPSRYEGFGIPVVEALASGCPLFISNQPALVETAAGRATVIDDDPLSVLGAVSAANRTAVTSPVSVRSWSECAAGLVSAMRASSC